MSTQRWISWAIIVAMLGAMLHVLTSSEPKLPVSLANGSFINSSIGTLTFEDGQMTVDSQHVDYVIERDKVGAYILPEAYVGVSNRYFAVNRKSYPLKLRLDDPARPRRVDLIDDARHTDWSFDRVSGS